MDQNEINDEFRRFLDRFGDGPKDRPVDRLDCKHLTLPQIQDRIQAKEFPKENAFVLDPAIFVAAQCSRRAGKSNGLGLRFWRTMWKYPNSVCRYIALTRESAKNIMWPVLQEQDDRFKIGAVFTESNLTISIPNGAKLQLFGADMKNFIRRLKGVKSPGVGVDEAQDFGPHLVDLVEGVLEPTIADYPDGWLALSGTPGPIPSGLFYDITETGLHDYSTHKWTLFDNPYMPNARAFVDSLIRKHGWGPNHPTLLREWYNQWVLDRDALVFQYDASRNDYLELPKQKPLVILGIDIGFRDADAIAVLGWYPQNSKLEPGDASTYLIEEVITRKQGLTPLIAQIESLRAKYDVYKIIMDMGGLGKKIGEELSRRYKIPVEPAEKQRKMEHIELLNDALRTGHFKAKKESQFAKDAMVVEFNTEKSTPDRKVISERFHSDICDAVLYGWFASYSFSFEAPKQGPKPGSKEWAKEEEDKMWEQELETAKRKKVAGDFNDW